MVTLFGVELYAQQVLSMVSVALFVFVNILWYTIGRTLTIKHEANE